MSTTGQENVRKRTLYLDHQKIKAFTINALQAVTSLALHSSYRIQLAT
jgi:hypothetical protein